MISKHCLVTGKVQGVFFRRYTQQKALSLGLKGWVRNLDSGEVECVVCGETEKVEALCQWLHQGPPAAQVIKVKVKEVPYETFETFSIVR